MLQGMNQNQWDLASCLHLVTSVSISVLSLLTAFCKCHQATMGNKRIPIDGLFISLRDQSYHQHLVALFISKLHFSCKLARNKAGSRFSF